MKGEVVAKKDKKDKKTKKLDKGKNKGKLDFSQDRKFGDFPDVIRFTPFAWAKMLYLRDKGYTEISGFALTDAKDPYLVIDFMMPKQECSGATTEMTSEGIVELFDKLSGPAKFGGMGISPSRYGRIWIHTHPGFSSEPSGTDWSTFRDVFGDKDWAIMFVLGKGKEATCILRLAELPKGHFRIPWDIDWDYQFPASDFEAWDKEYDDKVSKYTTTYNYGGYRYGYSSSYGNRMGQCDICRRQGVYTYSIGDLDICWNCKKDISPDFVGMGYGKCEGGCGKADCYRYRATSDDKGLLLCYDCKDKLVNKYIEESCKKNGKIGKTGGREGPDYSSWDELMEVEDETDTEGPNKCDGCGSGCYLLNAIGDKWLCMECEAKLRHDKGFTTDDNTAPEPEGGFLEDKEESKEEEKDDTDDSIHTCDWCGQHADFLTLIQGTLDEDDEYVCDVCLAEDRKLDQELIFGAEDDSDGGFETEDDEVETPSRNPRAPMRDETMDPPFDRLDDPRFPIC